MQLETKDSGRQKLKETIARLKKRQHLSGRKSIFEMDLNEAIEAEKKFIKWSAENPEHEELTIQTHIYTTYLLPRIAELQHKRDVVEQLGIELSQERVIHTNYQVSML